MTAELITMDDWQDIVAAHMKPHVGFLSAEGIWLGIVKEAGALAYLRRRGRFTDIDAGHVARMLCQCFVLADRVGFSLGEAVWHKFPMACPYCVVHHKDRNVFASSHIDARYLHHTATFGALARCICDERYKDYPRDDEVLAALRAHRDRGPRLLGEFRDMIASMYSENHEATGIEAHIIIDHLVEEINEVAVEILACDAAKCQLEVADVFTWVCSLATWKKIDVELALAELLGFGDASVSEVA